MASRIPPVEAATTFLAKSFPHCSVAILGGSAAHGMITPVSDLDIVILDESLHIPFHKTYASDGWIIETFVVTQDSLEALIDTAAETALPSLLRMCTDGRILCDDGSAVELIDRARQALVDGPYVWSSQDIDRARYEITDALLDLLSSDDRAERLFITGKLTSLVHEFILRTERQWIGDGKWALRALRSFDSELSDAFVAALESLYLIDEHEMLDAFIQKALYPYGGFLTANYCEGDQDDF
jgi:hypothetical protein